MSERCNRCGEVGEDRRTLWMACLYAMDELRIPFELHAVLGVPMKLVGHKIIMGRHRVPEFAVQAGKFEPQRYPFFTLRVCKACRGAWMGAIEKWFLDGLNRCTCTPEVGICPVHP